jgi:hypothetical protein
MKFTALPYSVNITKNDGKVVSISTHNAEGIFKSVRLDEAKEKINTHLVEYQSFTAEYETMSDVDKATKETYEKLTRINKQLRGASIEYLRECIKDIDKHVETIDEIKGQEMPFFMSAIERSMFGNDDTSEEPKKKMRSSISSKSSVATVTPRKRSKRGTSSSSITS